MLSNDPNYKLVFHSDIHNVDFYMAEKYHLSRYIAAGSQNIYSASGCTKEYLDLITNKMIEICNGNNTTTAKTDMALLANNIRTRLAYPIDEDCAIRMGAIYAIMDGEDPDKCESFWVNKKMVMCKGDANTPADPDMYTFFLNMGYQSTPEWNGLLPHLEAMEDYLTQRNELLQTMIKH